MYYKDIEQLITELYEQNLYILLLLLIVSDELEMNIWFLELQKQK